MPTNNRPTLLKVMDNARSIIGDDNPPTGTVYTNMLLLPHVKRAVRDLFRLCSAYITGQVIRTIYPKLPANSMTIAPLENWGIGDFLEPVGTLGRRYNVTFLAVSAAVYSVGPPPYLTVTVSDTTGITEGSIVTASGFGDYKGVDGIWTVHVVDGTTLQLTGCVPSGTFSTTYGPVIGYGTDQFASVYRRDSLVQPVFTASNTYPNVSLYGQYDWIGGLFHFQPAKQDSQLQIQYYASGDEILLPTDIISIPDSIDYLATQALIYATVIRAPQFHAMLVEMMGDPKENRSSISRAMVLRAVRAMQANVIEDNTRPGFGAQFEYGVW